MPRAASRGGCLPDRAGPAARPRAHAPRAALPPPLPLAPDATGLRAASFLPPRYMCCQCLTAPPQPRATVHAPFPPTPAVALEAPMPSKAPRGRSGVLRAFTAPPRSPLTARVPAGLNCPHGLRSGAFDVPCTAFPPTRIQHAPSLGPCAPTEGNPGSLPHTEPTDTHLRPPPPRTGQASIRLRPHSDLVPMHDSVAACAHVPTHLTAGEVPLA